MADGYISQIKTLDNKVYLLKDSEKTDEKVAQVGNAEDKDFPIILKNTNDTTNETANVKYSNNTTTDATTTKPFTFNPSTGTLKVTQIKIGTKDDSKGLFPNLNNWNQIGSSSLYWYRSYINNYYGGRSHVDNWDSGKNIGTAATASAAAVLGTVNFYNTAAAGATQTKTLLTADSTANSNITITLPKTTGILALKSELPTLSGLGGIGTISASGTAPLTLSGSKSGTTYTLTGSVADASASASGIVNIGAQAFAGIKTFYDHYTNGHIASTTTTAGQYAVIRCTNKGAWMTSFHVRIYTSYESYTLEISGYNYNTSNWYSPKAIMVASTVTSKVTVTFGYDNDATNNYKTLWVAIPLGNYPGIDVQSVVTGHSDTQPRFSVTIQSGVPATVQTTVDAYRPWYRNETVATSTKSGVTGIWLYPENNNELNFGGTNDSTTIFIGYRAKDSRAIPTKFIFGSSTGTADLQAKTVYLGSGTSSYISSTQYTGNAATATTATRLTANTSFAYADSGLTWFDISGTAGQAVQANDTPTTAWWHILRFNHSNTNSYYTDLAIPFNSASIYYKRILNGAVSGDKWVKVLDEDNYSSYALPLSGGTMSGHIFMGGSNASSSTANTTQLVFGTSTTQHIAVTSNDKAFILNPSTSSTTNQIVLYLNKKSKFPSGIEGDVTGDLTGNATTAGAFSSGTTVKLTGDTTGESASSTKGWSLTATTSKMTATPITTLNSQAQIDAFLEANKLKYGLFKTSDPNNVGMASNDGLLISMGWSSTTYGAQLAFDDATSGVMKFRGKGTNWGEWRTVAHNGNVSTGDADGQIKIAGTNVSVKGLAALAYKASLSYSDVGALANTTKYAASDSIGGAATNATTTANTTDSIYPVGVKSGATTTLLHDTSITMKGGAVSATTYTVNSHVTLQYNSTDSSLEFVFA